MSNRVQLVSLYLAASTLIGIALEEGFRDRAYIPVPGDVPTIGFGTTSDVKLGDRISPEQALVRLLKDAEKFDGALKQCVKADLHPYEYEAYLSLSYNIGSNAFCKSTLVKKLNAYDYEGACKEILRWDKFKGEPLPGLTNRRKKEYTLCIGKSH
jgi:lysozyme